MFAIGDVLISDALIDAPFTCDLGACRGACCVVGDRGAPLLGKERAGLERAAKVLAERLRPEGRAALAERGAWEEEQGRYHVRCADDGPCAFVVYEGEVALCAIQQAHDAGELDEPKPVSCALFPIRVRDLRLTLALNLEPMAACAPAVPCGRAAGVGVVEFLMGPLTRRFGEAFAQELLAEVRARRANP